MTNLDASRGDDWIEQFQCTQDDDAETPINITGYTVSLVISVNGVDSTYTTVPEVTVTPVTGIIDVHLAYAVTSAWGTNGTYRIRITSPAGVRTTIARGNIEVR